MRQSFRLVLALSLAFQPREAVAQAGALSGAVRLSEPVVTERGPHHRTWSRVTQITLPSGRVCYETNSYQELAGGMHYLNGQGVWTEARPLFELFPGGAIARQAQTQVILAPNANTAGAVDWRGPEGQRCRSHVLGITIIDRVSGESILIAELTDSIGELIAPAQILYRGALRGDGVVADLRYTVTRQGLEQDVIIRTWPVGASPVDWGLPPNGLYRLEVLSEFIEAPPPVRIQTTLRRENDEARRQAMAIPDLVDETLWWGSLMVGRGQAFPLGPQADETEREPVVKSFTQIQGRTFMIEGIEWAAVKAQVQALPATAALLPRRQDVQQARAPARDPKGEVQVARNMPPAPGVRPNDPAVRIPMASTPRPLDENKPGVSSQQKADVPSENSRVPASVHSGGAQSSILNSEKGFVLDYSTVVTANNMTLKGDTTFFVSGIITLSGTTLLESAVIKFTNGNTAAELKIQGPLDCRTDSHRPAIFAGKDDDSIGEIIPGSTGNPTTSYYGYYLDLAGNTNEIDLHDVRMRRGYYGIRMDSSSSLILRNAQISSNYTAVVNGKSRLRNVLIHDATYAYGGGGTNHHGEHVTFHRVAFLRSANLPSSYKTYLTNSLIISITSNVLYTGQNVISNLNDAGIFQTVGGGAHYLAAESAHRNAGTTNIDTNLLAQLKQRTTYPPILLASSIESDLTLSPQAQRDTDLPDIGYHYDPLDYLVSGVTIAPGVTVQAIGGVVLGLDYSQSSWGFILDSATFVSEASPLALNRIVRAHVAQEQGAGNPGQRALFYDNTGSYGGPPPRWCQARFRFTEFSQLSADGYLLYIGRALSALEFTHSRLYNPSLVVDTSGEGTFVCGLTNTLWEGGGVQFGTTSTGSGVSVHLRNNLLRNVSWHFIAGNTTWTVKDNLFDTLPALDDHGSPVLNSYNAYFSTTYNLSGGANNIPVGSLVYEMGPLGRYYQPVNSALIEAGSQSAAASGLYHYTTTANPQAAEAGSTVDIGLHWIALDAQNQPLDTDKDTLADYFEDRDGNGAYNAGDIADWTKLDTDGDSISDAGEIYKYGSDPKNPNTFHPAGGFPNDAEFLFVAFAQPAQQPCNGETMLCLKITNLPNQILRFDVSGATGVDTFDLYYKHDLFAQHERWQWRRVFTGIKTDANGEASSTMEQPDPDQGFFILLNASDDDGDGLGNGYEAWFKYNGVPTVMNDPESDGDNLFDGWEVEYGLNPTSVVGNDGETGNPDGDDFSNKEEHDRYPGSDGSWDPLKVYNTAANRPVVLVLAQSQFPICEVASFIIYRFGGAGADYTQPLIVPYAVGGNLRYGTDFTLDPAPSTDPGDPDHPDGYPRIFLAKIPENSQSVIVTATLMGHPVTSGEKTLELALTPYSVSPKTQDSNPLNWKYVVDLQQHRDRAQATFIAENLRPYASGQGVQACPNTSKQITLSGSDNCGNSLTFAIVDPPAHGTLTPINPPTSGAVTYTPSSGYCGADSFTFKVNNGAGDSLPATVTLQVGDPSPVANPQDVTTGLGVPVTFTVSVTDFCSETKTFTVVSMTGPANGQLIGPMAIDANHASFTYTPNAGFEGIDGFDFTFSGSCFPPFLDLDGHVTINVVSEPVLFASCREDRINLHWKVPPNVNQDFFFSEFLIYRCETTSASCTPTVLYDTVSSGSARGYVDTAVQPGTTYCYRVKFRHQNQWDSSDIYESEFSNTVCSQLCSTSSRALITGNLSTGNIMTVDFTDGSTINSFDPAATFNGRGLAIHNNEIFYTGVFNEDRSIHVCPYGSEGSGSTTDTRTFPNTWRPGAGIAALAVHANVLYVLTGYPDLDQLPLQMFKLNPVTGALIGDPFGIPIQAPAEPTADGFTVLPNGNFLINDRDGALGAFPYREYDATTGLVIDPPQGGLLIDLRNYGFRNATGVVIAPDGQSLYFLADFRTLVQTDMAGNLMGFQDLQAPAPVYIEDIDVVVIP